MTYPDIPLDIPAAHSVPDDFDYSVYQPPPPKPSSSGSSGGNWDFGGGDTGGGYTSPVTSLVPSGGSRPFSDNPIYTPQSLDDAKGYRAYLQQNYFDWDRTLTYYLGELNAQGVQYKVDHSSGTVFVKNPAYGQSSSGGGGGWDFGGGEEDDVEEWIPDPAASQALFNAQAYKREYDYVNDQLSDKVFGGSSSGGGGGGGGGYIDPVVAFQRAEGLKTAEVTRQFSDFVSRVESFYGMRADEQAYARNVQNANAQTVADIRAGVLEPGAARYLGRDVASPVYSRMVRETIPNDIPLPDYRLNHAVGLPGAGGFAPTGGAADDFYARTSEGLVPRYASGTPRTPAGRMASRNKPSGGGTDLHWMVGLPAFPVAPGTKPKTESPGALRMKAPPMQMPRMGAPNNGGR